MLPSAKYRFHIPPTCQTSSNNYGSRSASTQSSAVASDQTTNLVSFENIGSVTDLKPVSAIFIFIIFIFYLSTTCAFEEFQRGQKMMERGVPLSDSHRCLTFEVTPVTLQQLTINFEHPVKDSIATGTWRIGVYSLSKFCSKRII